MNTNIVNTSLLRVETTSRKTRQAITNGAETPDVLRDIRQMMSDLVAARDAILDDLTEDDVPMVKQVCGTVDAIILYRRFHREKTLADLKKDVENLPKKLDMQPVLTLVLVDFANGGMNLYVGDSNEPTGHPNLNICDFILSHPDATPIRLQRVNQRRHHDTTVGDLRKLADGWWNW